MMGWGLLGLFIPAGVIQFVLIGALLIYLALIGFLVLGSWRGIRDKRWRGVVVAVEILVLLALPIGKYHYHKVQQQKIADGFKEKRLAAQARFNELCKGSGEKIYRTVDDVEGLLVMKVDVDERDTISQYDQNAKNPYDTPSSVEGYIKQFLSGRDKQGRVNWDQQYAVSAGYRYVDMVDPADGIRYRYTAKMKEVRKKDPAYVARERLKNPNFPDGIFEYQLDRVIASDPLPRYGVTMNDISSPEDRKQWIAGSSLKIIDLQTNEVIAERVGYLVDGGLGSKGGGRQPWSFAQTTSGWSCPDRSYYKNRPRDFAEKVLKIRQINGQINGVRDDFQRISRFTEFL